MRTARPLSMALLAICLSGGLTACKTPPVKVLDPNTSVLRLPRGTNFNAAVDGYFVPDSTMLRILDHLSSQDVFGPPTK